MLLLETKNKLDENVFLLSGDEVWSYNQVFEAGDKLFDNKDKELVLILCEKNIATIVAYVGALRNNKVPLLVDKEYKSDLIKGFIEKYSPHYIFSFGDVEIVDDNYIIDNTFLDSYVYRRIQPKDYQIDDDLALLIPTSGSTGDPKCVRISSKNIDACTQSICEYLSYNQDRVAISFLPIHYSYGLSVLHNCIYKRAKYAISKLTILDKGMWDDVEKYQVTDFSGVPFTLKLMRKMKLDYEKIKTLQCVTQAGGYLPESDSSYFYKEFSQHGIRYFTMYGQTEASPRISYLDPVYAEEKSGTVGVPISCGSVFISETGEKTGTGELCYKGDNVALGYATGYEDLSLGDQFGGVLKTGDVVDIDSDGFIRIIGRNKRFIKISGISVNLDKIEKDLSEKFSSIVLIGKDDKLVAITENDEDQLSIKYFISDKYGFNKTLIKTKVVDSIPLNASGKTDYKLLNEKYC